MKIVIIVLFILLILLAIYSIVVLINLLRVMSKNRAFKVLAKEYRTDAMYIKYVIESSDFERERDVY